MTSRFARATFIPALAALLLLLPGCGAMLVDPDETGHRPPVTPAAFPPQDGWDEGRERSASPDLPMNFWLLYLARDGFGSGVRWVAIEESGRSQVGDGRSATRETWAATDLQLLKNAFNRESIEGLPGRNMEGLVRAPGGGYRLIVCRLDGRDRSILLVDAAPVPQELDQILAAFRRIGGFPR